MGTMVVQRTQAGGTVGGEREAHEQEVRARLRSWILERSARAAAVGLTDQTPILDAGLISSLDVVELVLFVEELRGEELATEEIEPEVFSSVDSLWRGFFSEQR